MARRTRYNPERKTWKGRSYKKGGTRIDKLEGDPCVVCGKVKPCIHGKH